MTFFSSVVIAYATISPRYCHKEIYLTSEWYIPSQDIMSNYVVRQPLLGSHSPRYQQVVNHKQSDVKETR